MANLSLIYEGLISLIESKLPTYNRLADAYDDAANDLIRIEKGYSLGISSGENTERYITGDTLASNRTFSFKITNLYTANEGDPVARATQEKALYEDAFLVWKELEKISVLNGIDVMNARYLSDDGIEYLGDEKKAITIISAISAEYEE